MESIRCNCGRLLCKAVYDAIEIKCPRCGRLNSFKRAPSPPPERPRASEDEDAHGKKDDHDG